MTITTPGESLVSDASMPETPTLAVRNLDISYRRGRTTANVVQDVSFSIGQGEAYGLVGESGCGKTTIAMSVMRYLPENAVLGGGSAIEFGGANILTASPSTLRRWRGDRIAMVYQNPGRALNPTMRIGTQLTETYRLHHGMSKSEAVTASMEMLDKVHIPDPKALAQRYPHELSGGQQQRVMIAMALSTSPDLLVLDEPTTGLDATVEAEVIDLVAALRTELRTSVLFISHNLGVVSRLCDRVGVLYAGRLVEEGPANALFAEPRHPYTLGLLRSAPRGGVRKIDRRLQSIPGSLPFIGHQLPGCSFAPRCPIAIDECTNAVPPLLQVAHDRAARCIRTDQVPHIPELTDAAVHGQTNRSEVLLKVDHLTKRYRSGGHDVTAVSDVTLEVHKGEVFGLVGESGSGKTTLAKCIVGMVQPTEGRLSFNGQELTGLRPRRAAQTRRRIQMVFQNPDTALNPRQTVRRILGRAVTLLSKPATKRAAKQEVEQLAESVRLELRHLDQRPTALSGGLKQRVAIGRAFAGSPELVLCDEPVSALDVSVQAAILNLLVRLQAEWHVAYIFITHDMAVVRYIADRIAVMYLGEIVEIGPADAVFQAPRHPYTEALMSAAPSLDTDGKNKRIRLDGTYPSVASPPSGCRFHTRCPRVLGDICQTEVPPWQTSGNGNTYKCHIPPLELSVLQRADSEVATNASEQA